MEAHLLIKLLCWEQDGVSGESRRRFPAIMSNPRFNKVGEWQLGRERFA